MSQLVKPRFVTVRTRVLALVVAACSLLALAVGGTSAIGGAKPSKRVVAERQSPDLGKTVLTTLGGRTLYTLSAETNGRFICTGSCLKDWFPVTVPAGTRPTGPVKLGTVVRPDNGRTQVTYKGRPLYHFDEDKKAGEANGEGFKDVGTWHAATPPAPKAEPAPQPQQPENPYSY